jgi:hypothetical protein
VVQAPRHEAHSIGRLQAAGQKEQTTDAHGKERPKEGPTVRFEEINYHSTCSKCQGVEEKGATNIGKWGQSAWRGRAENVILQRRIIDGLCKLEQRGGQF